MGDVSHVGLDLRLFLYGFLESWHYPQIVRLQDH